MQPIRDGPRAGPQRSAPQIGTVMTEEKRVHTVTQPDQLADNAFLASAAGKPLLVRPHQHNRNLIVILGTYTVLTWVLAVIVMATMEEPEDTLQMNTVFQQTAFAVIGAVIPSVLFLINVCVAGQTVNVDLEGENRLVHHLTQRRSHHTRACCGQGSDGEQRSDNFAYRPSGFDTLWICLSALCACACQAPASYPRIIAGMLVFLTGGLFVARHLFDDSHPTTLHPRMGAQREINVPVHSADSGEGTLRHRGNVVNDDDNKDHSAGANEKSGSSLHNMLQLQVARNRAYRSVRTGTLCHVVVQVLLLVVLLFGWFAHFAQQSGQSVPVFTQARLDAMNDDQKIYESFGRNGGSGGEERVVVVVLDGFRYDHMKRSPEMAAFLDQSVVKDHSLIYQAKAQIPSMSVPNWMTILTGATPEQTGVLGNIFVPETEFDSMFSTAQRMSIEADGGGGTFLRGLTGSPWFGEIILSTFPHLEGNGVIPTSFKEPTDRVSNDPADRERGATLVEALRRSERPYKLFLAHFSDIDTQGHCCGVTDEWNEDNTYMTAIANKTVILNQVVHMLYNQTFSKSYSVADLTESGVGTQTYPNVNSGPTSTSALLSALANATTVIITSDHGHVDRGGHGGTDDVLVDIPVIIWKSDSNLRANAYTDPNSPPPAPTAAQIRSTFEQKGEGGMFNRSGVSYFGFGLGGSSDASATDTSINAYRPFWNGFMWQDQHITNTDLSSTVSMLLNLPIPRQSMGVFINAAASLLPRNGSYDNQFDKTDNSSSARRRIFRDLYRQKRELCSRYVNQLTLSTGIGRSQLDRVIFNEAVFNPNHNETAYVYAIEQFLQIIEEVRDAAFTRYISRNVVINTAFGLALLGFVLGAARHTGWVDADFFRGLCGYAAFWFCCCKRPCCASSRLSGVVNEDASTLMADARSCCRPVAWWSSVLGVVNAQFRSGNMFKEQAAGSIGQLAASYKAVHSYLRTHSFWVCFAYFAVYYTVTLVIYRVAWALDGYPQFDSTVFHTTSQVPKYMAICLVPGAILQTVWSRWYHWKAIRLRRNPACCLCCSGGRQWREESQNDPVCGSPACEWVSDWLRYLCACYPRVACIECSFGCRRCVRTETLRKPTPTEGSPLRPANGDFGVGGEPFLSVLYTRYWMLAFTTFVIVLLFSIQGVIGMFLPYFFQQPFLSDHIWELRWQLLTVQLITLPLALNNLSTSLPCGIPEFDEDLPLYDRMLCLAVAARLSDNRRTSALLQSDGSDAGGDSKSVELKPMGSSAAAGAGQGEGSVVQTALERVLRLERAHLSEDLWLLHNSVRIGSIEEYVSQAHGKYAPLPENPTVGSEFGTQSNPVVSRDTAIVTDAFMAEQPANVNYPGSVSNDADDIMLVSVAGARHQ